MVSRRDFVKRTGIITSGLAVSGFGVSAKSYGRILGANDRIQVAIIGLGRRLGAFTEPIAKSKNNIELRYLCDVMPSQLEKAAERFSEHIDYQPKSDKDLRKILEDKE